MKLCSPILDALHRKGPFAACADMDEARINDMFNDCVFDICNRHGLICTIFSVFAKNCQLLLPSKWDFSAYIRSFQRNGFFEFCLKSVAGKSVSQ